MLALLAVTSSWFSVTVQAHETTGSALRRDINGSDAVTGFVYAGVEVTPIEHFALRFGGGSEHQYGRALALPSIHDCTSIRW